MCGFVGYALNDLGARADADVLTRMAQTLLHRGPDDGGVELNGPVGMAFRRLSIIDLSGGHQPFFNRKRDIVVTVNGEIYNFRELRRDLEAKGHEFLTNSDCETIVHLYAEYGERLVEHLVGMYAFCVLDLRDTDAGKAPRILLGRDRLGIKPLYFAETKSGLTWASEPKAILARGELDRELRPEALLDYMVQGYVGGPDAAWSGMQRLQPGHTLAWTPGEPVRLRRYWDLPKDELRDVAPAEEILEWLDRVVSDRLVADVPLGAFLSGGIDSSAVVASMSAKLNKSVLACSVGFKERSHDELDIARRTADSLGIELHSEVLEADPTLAVDTLPWFYDEPLADPSTVPTFLVSKMAREHVTVALSGDGGDETFGGYRRYVHDYAENKLRRALGSAGQALCRIGGKLYPKLDWAPQIFRARTFLSNVGDTPAHAYWHSVTQLSLSEARSYLAPDLRARLGDYDPFDAFRAHYEKPDIDCPLYRAQYADFHTYLPDQILTKVDRASMGNSLEVRVPILDHRFSERFANLPASQKVSGGRGKHVFREALRGRVSKEVLDGAKRGFGTPLSSWLKGPLRESVTDAVENLPDDWFDRSRLRQAMNEHQGGRVDHSRLLWSVLVLEQWRRRHEVRGLAT
ncbi:MAG: asparagine synthase (glutamine-hydrolyzing) [Planctomycetota bacterium]|jgi:asparagine synthase (glutamine-hydrolysing)